MRRSVLVIGGGIAASRTCLELRNAGHDGPITVVSAETHRPYDRPPLSKAALHAPVDTTLSEDLDDLGCKTLYGCSATAIDTVAQRVVTDRGDFEYEALVIATGARPVRLPGNGEQLELRTVEDAARIRAALTPRRRVTIIGSGWIGAEVATAALARGCEVTCIEAASQAYAIFGNEVAQELMKSWEDVDLRVGVGVAEVLPGVVTLQDGTSIESDVVITGVGVCPNVEWLAGSPIEIDRGIVVNERMQSSVPGIYAVGDVATRWSPRWERRLYALHWSDAAEAPAVVAGTLMGRTDIEYDPVPYFWSDQFGRKLQYAGVHDTSDISVHRRDNDGTLRGVAWLDASGLLTAYLALGRPRDSLQARLAIASRVIPNQGRLADASVAICAT